MTQEATLPNFGRVWFDECAIANILGFQETRKQKWITYDAHTDEFIVYGEMFKDNDIKFTLQDGIYQYIPDKKAHCMVNTLKENEGFYTP